MKKIKNISIVKLSYSLKLTVICLLILVFLTLFGTIYQSSHGLYEAKIKFFSSWIFLLGGFIPFPGGALTMSVLFINLLSSLFFRIGFRWKNIGNILTHLGILILLLGGFYTFLFSHESVLSLKEGTGSRFSNSYHQWELAVWTETNGKRDVYALDTKNFQRGRTFSIPELKLKGTINNYYINSDAFRKNDGQSGEFINGSGLDALREKRRAGEPSNNIPGIIFSIKGSEREILLYGNDNRPAFTNIRGKKFFFSLRKRRYLLPFYLKLRDFNMEKYPGSEIVKSYDSFVEIETKGLKRDVHISMNKPLRYKDFTLFQSSYYIDPENGTEYSVLAVVQNKGKYIPYISSILVFLGLMIHFIMMLIRKRGGKSNA